MIREIFDLFSWIFKLIGKGLKYSLKGIVWYLTNTSLLIKYISHVNKPEKKISKKQEIL
jgi:hypothetical protein